MIEAPAPARLYFNVGIYKYNAQEADAAGVSAADAARVGPWAKASGHRSSKKGAAIKMKASVRPKMGQQLISGVSALGKGGFRTCARVLVMQCWLGDMLRQSISFV